MEEKKETQVKETTAETKNEVESGKVFTQEDLNEVVSKKVNELKSKFEKEMQEQLTEAQAEAERLAKLSADEREAEIRKQEADKLADKDRSLNLRENKLTAYEMFSKEGLPTEHIDLVVDEDKDKMLEKIENFKAGYLKSVNEAVDQKLKGTPPKDVKTEAITPQDVKLSF